MQKRPYSDDEETPKNQAVDIMAELGNIEDKILEIAAEEIKKNICKFDEKLVYWKE